MKAGCIVIDNSSAFRMTEGVPLVVPEVNPGAISEHQGIIANPNCSTIIMNVAVWPLYQISPVKRVVVSTYQAASGAGAAAMAELEGQARAWAAGEPMPMDIFRRQYMWNLYVRCHYDMPYTPFCCHKSFLQPQAVADAECSALLRLSLPSLIAGSVTTRRLQRMGTMKRR